MTAITDADDTKMPLTSLDVNEERRQQLMALFPEAFTEGKLDLDSLKAALGDGGVTTGPERYELTWAGKSEAKKAIQALSAGTLIPAPDESVNFDTTQNLIIEGDNLEVLKLLQKSYQGKVKMIYIDPPYNTGGEFIYPDRFQEGLQDYLKFSGQVTGEGVRVSANTETEGRFHSKWMSMMYPRLFMAKNLLKRDGVIFISIDDNEIINLRLVMNEVFGEDNFVACIVWQKRTSPDARINLGAAHDYVLCYCRDSTYRKDALSLLPLGESRIEDYKNPDNDPNGPWASVDMTGQLGHATSSQFYTVTTPSGVQYAPPDGRCWALAESTFNDLKEQGKIWFGKDGSARPRMKRYLSEAQGTTAWTWWPHQEVGSNQEATQELGALFPSPGIFDAPKPTRLIKRLLQLATTSSEDIVLDFFAGSGTTAQAVMELNKSDEGQRRFILVQLPEPLVQQKQEHVVAIAFLNSIDKVTNISEITKERVRRAIKKMDADEAGKLLLTTSDTTPSLPDRGFKVFKLTGSNFKTWNADEALKDADALAAQLRLYANNLVESRTQTDVLYEILLKAGFPLTETVEAGVIEGHTVYSIAGGALLICLDNPIAEETLKAMVELDPPPAQVICLDAAFAGNDPLKTNIRLEMKAHSIEFRTV